MSSIVGSSLPLDPEPPPPEPEPPPDPPPDPEPAPPPDPVDPPPAAPDAAPAAPLAPAPAPAPAVSLLAGPDASGAASLAVSSPPSSPEDCSLEPRGLDLLAKLTLEAAHAALEHPEVVGGRRLGRGLWSGGLVTSTRGKGPLTARRARTRAPGGLDGHRGSPFRLSGRWWYGHGTAPHSSGRSCGILYRCGFMRTPR